MNLTVERAYPFAGGAAGGVAAGVAFYMGWTPPESTQQLFAAGVQLGAIAIGFIATAQAILISIDDRAIIARMKEIGYYRPLITYNLAALRWWALLTLNSVAAMLISAPSKSNPGAAVVASLWIGLVMAAVLSWWRVFSVYAVILAHGAQPDRGGSVVAPQLKRGRDARASQGVADNDEAPSV